MARRSQLSSSKEYCRMILMTNNQWKYDHNNEKWARLGMDCSADVRSAGLVRAYQQICPDILAVQESSHLMERLIMQSLFEYAPKSTPAQDYLELLAEIGLKKESEDFIQWQRN